MLLPPTAPPIDESRSPLPGLLADLALVGVNWQLRLAPRTAGDQLRVLRHQQELMTLDLRRAEAIRRDLPAVQRQCVKFFRNSCVPPRRLLDDPGRSGRHGP